MNIVKEYFDEKTKIRIHDDYIDTNDNSVKEIIIAIMINSLKNNISKN
ncbi:MAG: hypothetical protein IKD77_04725 [Bacilli bacterium]|nr:hypothetical protein [Bacilli bacterium]